MIVFTISSDPLLFSDPPPLKQIISGLGDPDPQHCSGEMFALDFTEKLTLKSVKFEYLCEFLDIGENTKPNKGRWFPLGGGGGLFQRTLSCSGMVTTHPPPPPTPHWGNVL
jgi:hypothetical protein